MKFFHINNSRCTSCDRCGEVCNTAAIYIQDEKRYINYDRCTVCGSCMKACNVGAVTVETLDRVTREMDNIIEYKEHIGHLEHELIQLKDQIAIATENLSTVVSILPLAVFVADAKLRIVVAGETLTRVLGKNGKLPQDTPKGLAGLGLDAILSEEAMRQVGAAATARQVLSIILPVDGRQVSLSIAPLAGGRIMGVARDLSQHSEVRDEIASKLRMAIENQLATVQKIGFLLGEEVSAVVADISSVINIVEKGEQK